MEHSPWLTTGLIYLAAAVLAVPLAKAVGLGAIIGYLAAGIAIGPWGLKLVTDPEQMLHFAEFGVVLMLFLVGLELEPRRLWALRKPIFGWGSAQLFGSAALMALVAALWGLDWRLALAAALGLAMSSTAIGLGVLNERNLMSTSSGQSVLSVALLQDVAAIPILALLPLLALNDIQASGSGWFGAAKALAVIAAIILGGRLLLRPALRWIARSDTPEVFTAAALLLVVATAASLWLASHASRSVSNRARSQKPHRLKIRSEDAQPGELRYGLRPSLHSPRPSCSRSTSQSEGAKNRLLSKLIHSCRFKRQLPVLGQI